MVRENIILICVQLNKLPGCKIGHSTAFPNIYYIFHKIGRDVKLVSSLVSISTAPDDLRTILVHRTTETKTARPVDRIDRAWKKSLVKQEHNTR